MSPAWSVRSPERVTLDHGTHLEISPEVYRFTIAPHDDGGWRLVMNGGLAHVDYDEQPDEAMLAEGSRRLMLENIEMMKQRRDGARPDTTTRESEFDVRGIQLALGAESVPDAPRNAPMNTGTFAIRTSIVLVAVLAVLLLMSTCVITIEPTIEPVTTPRSNF